MDARTRPEDKYNNGILHLSNKQWEDAILAFSAAISADREMYEAYLGRSLAYFKQNNFSQSKLDLEHIIQNSGTIRHIQKNMLLAKAYLGLANCYRKEGHSDDEKRMYDQAILYQARLPLDQQNPQIYFERAKWYYKNKQYQDALTDLAIPNFLVKQGLGFIDTHTQNQIQALYVKILIKIAVAGHELEAGSGILVSDNKAQALIAKGGFGEVSIGYAKVAIKCPPTETSETKSENDQPALSCIENEASMMRQLNHPNIVPLYYTLTKDGIPYIIMQYCANHSLHDYLNECSNPAIENQQKCSILLNIINALVYLHGLYIVHRDLIINNNQYYAVTR